jgi:RHS repeat-associated protein
MPSPARFWLVLASRQLASSLVRSRPSLVAAALTAIVAAMLVPGPWDASGAKAAKNVPQPERELVGLREAKSKTFREPDGRLRTTLYQQSVHYFDRTTLDGDPADHRWKDIEPDLKNSAKPAVAWQSGANRFRVELADTLKDGFLSYASVDGALSLSLEDAATGKPGVKAAANAVTFKDALDGVDLEYVVLPDGLKENIVLRKAGAPNEFRFRLRPEDQNQWRTEELEGGSYAFFEVTKPDAAFTLLPPVVGDSSGQATPQPASAVTSPPSWAAARDKASVKVEQDADGSFLVTLAIDEDWLSDSKRVYPVVLDPTLYSEPDVADGEYDTTNGGNPDVTATEMRTGRNGAGGAKYASALNFDLATLPPAAKVLDARLKLYLNACIPSTCASTYTGDVELRRLTSGWSSSTPWSSVTKDGTLLSKVSFTNTPTAAWYMWSAGAFTASVQNMVNGTTPNYGFILEKNGGDDTKGYKWRSSRWTDPTYMPYLEVYWTSDGVQVNPAMHLHSNGAELAWQHYAGGTSAYADKVLSDTPTAFWRLDEGSGTSAWDWSGNDLTATYAGGYTLQQTGALADLDSAVLLDGTSGQATASGINLANNSFSLEGWAKRASIGTNDWIIGQGPNTLNQGLSFGFNAGNKFACGFFSNDLQTSSTYTDTSWHHWVCTYYASTNTRTLYRDGVQVANDVASADYAGSGTLMIGNKTGAGEFFAGSLDDVAVYPSVLTPTQITDHFNAAAVTMPGFVRYEIHRSATQGFTPSPATLIGTIRDVAIQQFRDMSAKPGTTFYYKVLTVTDEGGESSFASNEVKADLPADGLTTVTIQPGFVSWNARGTHISSGSPNQTNGTSQTMTVGSAGSNNTRALLRFDMRTIPSGVPISSATLQMYATGTTGAINAHRSAAEWIEDSSWILRVWPGITWGAQGGDYDPTASAASSGGFGLHWDSWNLTSLMQDWVSGNKSYFGVELKYGSENGSQPTINWAADGFARSIALRPKMTVTYQDGSDAIEPVTSISSHAPGERVSGTETVKASANDDGSVKQVEFLLDGTTSLGTDTDGAPWQVSWNTSGVSRGDHTLSAKATDDAGNATVNPPTTTVKVVNGNSPTVSVATTPNLPNVDVTATASDDYGVTRVEFYAGSDRLASDSSSPYSATWNTLDETNTPGYDGSYAITAKAYDADGNVTSSSVSNVTVSNTTGTKYKGTFATSAVPQEVTYDPGAGSQEQWPLDVTITNTSTLIWPTASIKLRYRWYDSYGAVASPTPPDISIGSDLGAGSNRTVRVNVEPPALPDGTDRARYRLRIDLYDTGASATFASKGNRPFDTYAAVNRKTAVELGLEKYQHYDAEELGLGIDNLVNYANGNSLVHWTPFDEPGRGLNTVVDLTYNSRENGTFSPAGSNWSLSISGLTSFGVPLDIHPNAADTLAGRTAKWVAFTDGDGTYHRFDGFAVTGGTAYDAPPGVFLYLREDTSAPATERWALSRPDRVTYYFDAQGYATGVKDGNGNRLEFVLENVPAGEDAYGLAKRITRITDAAGIGVQQGTKPDRSFDVAYYSKAETPRPELRGKVKSITDHVGHKLLFSYYEDGNLLRLTEEGGTNADGSFLADRSVVFTYVKNDGSPAIANASQRLDPDPQTVQSRRLYSVIDPRQNETTFAYEQTAGPKQWRLSSRTNRAGKQTSYSYDTTLLTTTADRPLARSETFKFDASGRVLQITDPLNEVTTVDWFDAPSLAENLVKKVTQPHSKFEQWAYNDNGYTTSVKDELTNETTLTYENVAADANDVSTKWETGRTIPHWSQLATKTDPVGNTTPSNLTDYKWTFAYDGSGNLQTVTDPLNKVRQTIWNGDGTVQKEIDGLQRETLYNTYDENGIATKVTDAAGGIVQASYDARGSLLWLQDPNHASYTGGTTREYRSIYEYDSFGRLGRSSDPRSKLYRPGELTWNVSRYDANDNELAETNPHFGRWTAGVAPMSSMTYDTMDRPTLETSPRTQADGSPIQSQSVYDDAGRVIKEVAPNGVATGSLADDYVSFTSYDKLDRVYQEWSFAVDGSNNEIANTRRTTSYCYDLAGDLRSVTQPKGAATFSACPTLDPPSSYNYTTAGYTTKYEYDEAHRLTKTTDALGNTTVTGYDENSQVTSDKDENGFTTTTTYNDRGEADTVVEPFEDRVPTPRVLTTKYEYDAEGNLKRLISPRAFDAAGGGPTFTDYVEQYTYDNVDRLVKTALPSGPNPYASLAKGQSPYAYWRLGESSGTTMADTSGNGRAGTYVNSPTLGGGGALPGDSDTAMTVAPTNYTATASGISLANQSFSISFWMKRAASGTTDYAVGQGTNTTNNGLRIGFKSGNTFEFGFIGNNLATTATYTDTNWHQWAATYDASTNARKIYRDGVEVASDTATADYQGTGSLVLGSTAWNGSGDSMQSSSLDDVGVWMRPLGPAEVQHQYGAGTTGATPPAYTHDAYDKNGNLTMVSLPTDKLDPALLNTAEETTSTYWDDGNLFSSTDPSFSKIRYEYSPEGWQTSRMPESSPGVLDLSRYMGWRYYPDGLVRDLWDSNGQRALYSFDADGNQTLAVEADGIQEVWQSPLRLDTSFDQFDQLATVKAPKLSSSNFWVTKFNYDLHGNTSALTQNEEDNGSGGLVTAGRVQTYTYDNADQPLTQVDDYGTSGTTDDERISLTWTPTGLEASRKIEKAASPWTTEQETTRGYFRNGQIKTLVSTDGAMPTPVTLESHTMSYEAGGIYQNGNRTSDAFLLRGPDTAAPCRTTTCTQSWSYDARERLTNESTGTGTTTDYTNDVPGNVTQEKANGTVSRTATYSGQQLSAETVGGTTTRYFYDGLGNLDCTTPSSYVGSACPGSVASMKDYTYDYKNRLIQYQYYVSPGVVRDRTTYTNDPLDRPVRTIEAVNLDSTPSTTTTDLVYIGLSDAIGKETLTGGTVTTKTYVYDSLGRRATLANGSSRYSYLNDPYGSVSVVVDQNRVVKEAYGYTGYGNANSSLTKSVSGFNPTNGPPTNAYRFSAKRWDKATGSYDMGARRYSASTGRFMQRDAYDGALDNLDLSSDPLTGNRYALAAGNPVNFVETDGHWPSLIDKAKKKATGVAKGFAGGVKKAIWDEPKAAARNAVAHPVGAAKDAAKFTHGALACPACTGGKILAGMAKGTAASYREGGVSRAAGYAAGSAVGLLAAKGAGRVSTLSRARVVVSEPYKRPSGATTVAQRRAVQGQPCVECGALTSKQVANHRVPLSKEYYTTGRINTARMRSVDSVNAHCPTCSAREGARQSQYSKTMKSNLPIKVYAKSRG